MLDFGRFTYLTFDCYGTLVDWETGILHALRSVFERHHVHADGEQILSMYSELEAAEERLPYRSYRQILRAVTAGIAARSGFVPAAHDLDVLAETLGDWPLFRDTYDALARLKARYRLAIISNVDDDLFLRTNRHLGSPFYDVITAQQVGSYKPSLENFRFALNRLGAKASEVLHVAQSLYHDHVPARELGIASVWVNRPSLRRGVGLALPAGVQPDMEVPDLRGLVDAIERAR